MGYDEDLKTVGQCDSYVEQAVNKGSVEFTEKEFKILAPECFR